MASPDESRRNGEPVCNTLTAPATQAAPPIAPNQSSTTPTVAPTVTFSLDPTAPPFQPRSAPLSMWNAFAHGLRNNANAQPSISTIQANGNAPVLPGPTAASIPAVTPSPIDHDQVEDVLLEHTRIRVKFSNQEWRKLVAQALSSLGTRALPTDQASSRPDTTTSTSPSGPRPGDPYKIIDLKKRRKLYKYAAGSYLTIPAPVNSRPAPNINLHGNVAVANDVVAPRRTVITVIKDLEKEALGDVATARQLEQLIIGNCPVCKKDYEAPVMTSCGHIFCLVCMISWGMKAANCPTRREHQERKDITNLVVDWRGT